MIMEKLKVLLTVISLGFFTTGCSVGVPSPLKTGSWYYGEIDSDHIGFDIVFPWATRPSDKESTE